MDTLSIVGDGGNRYYYYSSINNKQGLFDDNLTTG